MECRRTNRPIKPEKSEFNEYLCPTEEYRPSRLFQLASVKLKEMVYSMYAIVFMLSVKCKKVVNVCLLTYVMLCLICIVEL
jgi:hypothetical protein